MEAARLLVFAVAALICCWPSCTGAKRILLVPAQITSHCFELEAITRGLRQNGHEVFIALAKSFPKRDKVIERGLKPLYFDQPSSIEPVDKITGRLFELSGMELGNACSMSVLNSCDAALHDTAFMNKLREMKFDLAVVDGFVLSFCHLLIPHTLKIPFVFEYGSVLPWLAGVPSLPSIQPLPSGAPMIPELMSFSQRIQNLVWHILEYGFMPFTGSKDTTLLREFAPDVATWADLALKADLYFSLRNHLLEPPMISMPHFIQMPGVTVSPPKPLPDEFERIMKKSATGVILVSFGSLANNFPEEITDKLIEVVNRLPYTVLWKFSGKFLESTKQRVREHVHVFSWIPQNDILGHPNCRVFVTHCGNNGQHESLYHAVPMVGMPIFAEQIHNAFRIVEKGFGLSILPLGALGFTVDEVVEAVNEVASNSTYKEAIKKQSEILKDIPMDPGQTATFWLEHILKFGAGHLKPKTMNMPWYQYFMIDILAFIICIGLIIVCVLCALIRYCFKKFMKATKVKEQ